MAIEKNVIAEKLRLTSTELGREALIGAVIVGPHDLGAHISTHQYVYCPTLGEVTLGDVQWKTARFFEDIEAEDK